MSGKIYTVEVQPVIPEKLAGIETLANDLLYSWDRRVRGLFYRLDKKLWEQCNHNPKVFLRRASQEVLDLAADDQAFMEEYKRVISVYESYHQNVLHASVKNSIDADKDLIAYFCAEFGFHESFPIYSGGLGILAGDHCKAASDLGLPFVAVGLLYRQGYFTQTIDGAGQQMAHYHSVDFGDLMVHPATTDTGQEVTVTVSIEDRDVVAKVWEAKAGHINLYLLDTDLAENKEQDRSITFQLYGGDKHTRIQQEIVLGIGGVYALRALGISPTAWHINEGHAAFQIIERCREEIQKGLTLNAALELVAAGTVFTTHTPVAAGHDIFEQQEVAHYLSRYFADINIDPNELLKLGCSANGDHEFNMTALALRGSRFHNGVSRIHGRVASQMESYVWPQIPYEENPMGYVTNGVHVPTFLARAWMNLFDVRFRNWRTALTNQEYWERVDSIPDHHFWSLRQELKARMLEEVNQCIVKRFSREGYSKAMTSRICRYTSQPESNVLVLGFARRFATYKRATLLFNDLERFARLLNDPDRPVLLVFAGKAHPNDVPGQQLIQAIHDYSLRPEFIGKIHLLEGYDMSLARKLVTGVDVWINTPEHPLEASGTSGQKAAINGVINLSVLDGWWGEGYDGENGWAIYPHTRQKDAGQRDREEANDLLALLENEIVPDFYDRGTQGYSTVWVKRSKASMKSCIPRFSSQRMVVDYVKKYYGPASAQYALLAADERRPAQELAAWKEKVRACWAGVKLRRVGNVKKTIRSGTTLPIRIGIKLNGLSTDDITVECLLGEKTNGKFRTLGQQLFEFVEMRGKEHIYELHLTPATSGLNTYKLRAFPCHELLSHPLETGCIYWV